MPSSTPAHKFLLDENVRIELLRFLKKSDFDVKLVPKQATDKNLALLSKSEKRILVTNDRDFTGYSSEEVFSVVWLQIAQNDPQGLLNSFVKLLNTAEDLEGKLIILQIGKWDEFPLSKELKM